MLFWRRLVNSFRLSLTRLMQIAVILIHFVHKRGWLLFLRKILHDYFLPNLKEILIKRSTRSHLSCQRSLAENRGGLAFFNLEFASLQIFNQRIILRGLHISLLFKHAKRKLHIFHLLLRFHVLLFDHKMISVTLHRYYVHIVIFPGHRLPNVFKRYRMLMHFRGARLGRYGTLLASPMWVYFYILFVEVHYITILFVNKDSGWLIHGYIQVGFHNVCGLILR